MVPGWPYSIVAALEPGRSSWTVVLDAVRLGPGPDDDVAEVTAAQVRRVVGDLIDGGQWERGDPDILVVFDAGYDAPRMAYLLDGLPVEVLGRMRSDRVMRRPAPSREEFALAHPGGGRYPRHGGEFRFVAPDTWGEPDAATVQATDQYATARATAWDRLHPRLTTRSAWIDHEGELPVIEGTLIRLEVDRLPGGQDPLPLWLWSSKTGMTGADGDRRWQAFLRRFDLEHVRHEAPHNRVEVEDLRPRTVAAVRVKQGAARPGERRDRVESSPDNAGTGRNYQTTRVRQARPEGATRVNQWLTPRKSRAGSNLVDLGRYAVRVLGGEPGATPKPYVFDGQEATLKVCGVGVAMLPGYSWAPHRPIGGVVNVGTARGRPHGRAASPACGQVRCRLSAVGRGGGPVVVRAHERCVHGEGGQQVGRADAGMPGGRR